MILSYTFFILPMILAICGHGSSEYAHEPPEYLASFDDSEYPDYDFSTPVKDESKLDPLSIEDDPEPIIHDDRSKPKPTTAGDSEDFYVEPEFSEDAEEDSGEYVEEEIDEGTARDVLNWVQDSVGGSIFDDVDANSAILSTLPEGHSIVYPVQIRKNEILGLDTHDTDKLKSGIHYHRTHILFKDFDIKYRLKLALNRELISRDIKHKRNINDNTQIIEEGAIENCFYHGEVKKFPGSKVIINTCNGISGLIVVDDEIRVIRPLEPLQINNETNGNWTRWPHALYRIQPSDRLHKSGNHRGEWQSFRELHVGEFMRRRKIMAAMTNQYDVLSVVKTINLALVADHELTTQLNRSASETYTYLLQLANIMDAVFEDMNIQISVNFLEIWNSHNMINMDTNARVLLFNFLKYRQETMTFVSVDIAHLLTGSMLRRAEVGMAIPDSVCSSRAVAVSQGTTLDDQLRMANGILHMVGHILGVTEQPEGLCACPHEGGCLMQVTANKSITHHALTLSPCARSSLEEALLGGLGACLLEDPPREVFPQNCGNGRLERGEECDCLSVQECRLTDPCCDAETCLLRPWSTCRFGDCCQNCSVLPTTHLCRLGMTECDVPEFCNGDSGYCPANHIVQNGWSCGYGDDGYCYQGQCQTYLDQCQTIWGPDTLPADKKCYETFNTAGRFNGHCGPNSTTTEYVKCDESDVGCGLLHCAGGNTQPLVANDKTFSTTTVNSGGNNYQCKILSSHHPPHFPSLGLVQEGTKCDNFSICVNTKCVSLETMVTGSCPMGGNNQICSGRGKCTDDLSCFCNTNFTGSDCSTYRKQTTFLPQGLTTVLFPETTTPKVKVTKLTEAMSTTTLDSPLITKAEKSVSTMWLVIVLSSVAGGALILLGCFMLCYRRRTTVSFKGKKKKKKNPSIFGSITSFSSSNSKGSKSRDETEEDFTSRIISFGNMPSYRADKQKKMMRKSLGGISEQSEESEHSRGTGDRDSTEVKIPNTLPLAKPPEKGILKKKFPHSADDLSRTDSESPIELMPLRRLGAARVTMSAELPRRPLPEPPVCGESGETQAMLATEEDCEDECGSCCSCEKKSDLSLSDLECDDCCMDARDQQTQTDPESGGSPDEMPRDLSSDSLEGAKNKISKLKNINELLKQIDEQFNSVLRQTTQGDLSPSGSEELRCSETEADRHFPRNSFYKQSDIEEGYSPPHRSPILSPNPSNQANSTRYSSNNSASPEPLTSPSGILSPIQAQSPRSLSSPFSAGVPSTYKDPLRGPRHTTSTPKAVDTAPPLPPRNPDSPQAKPRSQDSAKRSPSHGSPKPMPRHYDPGNKSRGKGSPQPQPRHHHSSPHQSPQPQPRKKHDSPQGSPSRGSPRPQPRFQHGNPQKSTPAKDKDYCSPTDSVCPPKFPPLSPTGKPAAGNTAQPPASKKLTSPFGSRRSPKRQSPPKLSAPDLKQTSPKSPGKGSPKNENHSNNKSGKFVDPPVTVVPYRGAKSSLPNSPTLPRHKEQPSPTPSSSSLEKVKGHKVASPKSAGSSFLSKLAQGLEGNPFKRRGSQSNDINSVSDGYCSDRAEADDAVIVREIPAKKPVELPFMPNPNGSYTRAPGSPGSPEDINV